MIWLLIEKIITDRKRPVLLANRTENRYYCLYGVSSLWSKGNLTEVLSNAVLLGWAGARVGSLTVSHRLLHHSAHPVKELLAVEGRAHEADGDVLANGITEGVEGVVKDSLVGSHIRGGGLGEAASDFGYGPESREEYCWRRSMRKSSAVFIFLKKSVACG